MQTVTRQERESDEVPRLLLTPEQGARAIHVSRTVIFQLIRSGELASVRIGRSRRIPVTALQDYVARLQEPGVSA